MTQPATVRNPFMLMINPEVVVAAMEKSERLGQLNRHLCRPLDKPAPNADAGNDVERDDDGDAAEREG